MGGGGKPNTHKIINGLVLLIRIGKVSPFVLNGLRPFPLLDSRHKHVAMILIMLIDIPV